MSVEPVDKNFLPISGMDLPRFAGIPSFMRLPQIAPGHPDFEKVEIGLIGVPWDGGTTNRPGARHGPRQLRDSSTMIRMINQATLKQPFFQARCADLGDTPVNPADVQDTIKRVTTFYEQVVKAGIIPMTAGGDHLVSLPVLRALHQGRELSMIHFDAHTDLYASYFGGFTYTHGTPFRLAIEEGILNPKKVVQIGLRGSSYDMEDIEFGRKHGVRMVMIEELMEKGCDVIMDEARDIVGDTPTYVSFDIDGIDPSFAPGTGTPEIGGFTSFEAQKMVRRLEGLNLVGADLVEVSPPFDPSGQTAWVGVSIMFELLCVLANKIRPLSELKQAGGA